MSCITQTSTEFMRLTATGHHFVELGLQVQLRMARFDALQFDGHLVSGRNVCACDVSITIRQSPGQRRGWAWDRLPEVRLSHLPK